MVVLYLIQSREQMSDHQEEVNCDPLSLVIIAGTPKMQDPPVEHGEGTLCRRNSNQIN